MHISMLCECDSMNPQLHRAIRTSYLPPPPPLLQEAILKKRGEASTQHQPMAASSLLGRPPSTQCLIRPVSGQARLTRNCSQLPLRISDGPRLHVDVRLEEIPISLSDGQYRLLMKLIAAFRLRVQASKFKRWRPAGVGVVVGKGGVWWRFATDATLHEIRRRNERSSVRFALFRARQNVVYVKGYTQHLTEVRGVKGEEPGMIGRGWGHWLRVVC